MADEDVEVEGPPADVVEPQQTTTISEEHGIKVHETRAKVPAETDEGQMPTVVVEPSGPDGDSEMGSPESTSDVEGRENVGGDKVDSVEERRGVVVDDLEKPEGEDDLANKDEINDPVVPVASGEGTPVGD